MKQLILCGLALMVSVASADIQIRRDLYVKTLHVFNQQRDFDLVVQKLDVAKGAGPVLAQKQFANLFRVQVEYYTADFERGPVDVHCRLTRAALPSPSGKSDLEVMQLTNCVLNSGPQKGLSQPQENCTYSRFIDSRRVIDGQVKCPNGRIFRYHEDH